MTNQVSIKREILEVFKKYIHAYFYERDFEKILPMLSSSVSGFGTDSEQKAFNIKQVQELYLRNFEQLPNPIEVDSLSIQINLLANNIALVLSEININTQIQEVPLELKNLRITVIFKKVKNDWLLEHQHISLPTSILKPEESLTSILREFQETLTELEVMAKTDKLTGVSNRAKFDEIISYTIEYIKRYQSTASLILIDIDFFKNINDVYGHLTGDKVLKEIAQTLNTSIRNVDTLARWGGEEFIILLSQTTLAAAQKLAERIRERIYEHDFEIDHRVSISLGVTEYIDGDTVDTWIQRADDALYLAKRHGRNRVETR